jgi:hypothetical protein
MKIFAAVVLSLISSFAVAQQERNKAVALFPMSGDSQPSVSKVVNVYGKCGDAVVAILGIEAESFGGREHFRMDSSGNPDLQLRKGDGKDLSFNEMLSDFNVVQCVDTKKGNRLVVGSHCGGSACGDNMAYHVIDPKTGKAFPGRASKDVCDEKCVNSALGVRHFK